MEDVLVRARSLVESFGELVRAELPPDAELFDAHVHLGLDIDGMRGDLDELLRIQQAHGISRSFMFCLDEPDRHPGFRAPNDRTLASAERSEGRLVPFVRLDLTESPIEEAVRCLDRGAGGIKLHPRAQKFLLDDERLAPVFELAAERRVPILIHGGRGLPPIADALARLMDAYEPQLIIAHAGIADLAALTHHFSGRPASSSTPLSGARSTCSTSTGSSRPSRCSTPPTTPTARSPAHCSPRSARRGWPGSTTNSSRRCSAAAPAGSRRVRMRCR